MSSLVIVALPAEDDYVNKISSEKVAHMTLLFLGEMDNVKNFPTIMNYVRHATEESLCRFDMNVDRRGELGPESADVLFFKKMKWGDYSKVRDFRSYLLKEPNIREAYDSTEQFPEWIPHLTLGFPETPAIPDERDYPGIHYVNFDRIAVWTEDFDGFEFPLKSYDWEMDGASWGSVNRVVDNILEHVGVKGMKWGVRRNQSSSISVRDVRKKIKTSGGFNLPAHEDALRAHILGQKVRKSGTKALSNEELKLYTQRLNLEQSAKGLNSNQKNAGRKYVAKILNKTGESSAQNVANLAAGAAVGAALVLAKTHGPKLVSKLRS